MGKVIRREFLGSRKHVVLLFLSIIGIPLGVIYILVETVTIEEELDDPTAFLESHKRKYSG